MIYDDSVKFDSAAKAGKRLFRHSGKGGIQIFGTGDKDSESRFSPGTRILRKPSRRREI
jgi:hypothetical protein